jgi:hypothetical protein
MLFNFIGVLLFVFLIPYAERPLNKVLPDKTESNTVLKQPEVKEYAFDDN